MSQRDCPLDAPSPAERFRLAQAIVLAAHEVSMAEAAAVNGDGLAALVQRVHLAMDWLAVAEEILIAGGAGQSWHRGPCPTTGCVIMPPMSRLRLSGRRPQ
jgi:hypothetical protein